MNYKYHYNESRLFHHIHAYVYKLHLQYTNTLKHIYKKTHTHIYIYIYIYNNRKNVVRAC